MGGKLIDLTGQRFGRLVVVGISGKNKYGEVMWNCVCDCGNTKVALGGTLRHGHVRSCGCLALDRHGGTGTRLHQTWKSMKKRCYNPNNKGYRNYGGRGITVCDEWRNSFEAFRDWALANGYRDGLSIDRIDPNGNYCPENCRWATDRQQANNRRVTKHIVYGGRDYNGTDFAALLGVHQSTVIRWLKAGYTPEEMARRAGIDNIPEKG